MPSDSSGTSVRFSIWQAGLCCLLALAALSCDLAVAASVDDLSYTTANGEVTITGCATSATGSLVIPPTIESNPVTAIATRAFYTCQNLTAVTIPDSCATIGDEAFRDCFSMGSITLPSSLGAIGSQVFLNCYSLSEVVVPGSVTTIGARAFRYCRSLSKVTVPASVASIADYAFTNCPSLLSVFFEGAAPSLGAGVFTNTHVPPAYVDAAWIAGYGGAGATYGGLTVTDASMYDPQPVADPLAVLTWTINGGQAKITDCDANAAGSLTIPDTLGGAPVTAIGSGAFGFCRKLTHISLPDSVISTDISSFNSCHNLKTIDLGTSLTTIAYSAFANCHNLTSITIPDTTTSISDQAFEYCHRLAGVTFGNSVDSIGTNAFRYCYGLAQVTIPGSVTSVGSNAFRFCHTMTAVTIADSVTSLGNGAFNSCTSLQDVAIGTGITAIGSQTFFGCNNLKAITIPGSVTSIGDSAFRYCSHLASVAMDGTASIGTYAFESCSSLVDLRLSASLDSIANYAFQFCTSLTRVQIPSSVSSIGDNAFRQSDLLEHVVFAGGPPATVGFVPFYLVASGAEARVTSAHAAAFGGVGATWNGLTVALADSFTLSTNALANGSVSSGGTFLEGSHVLITATPDPGYEFAGWTGDAGGLANPLYLLIDGNKQVTATFGQPSVFADTIASAAPGLTGDDALPDATPFNDGVPNLLKYAFNMNLAGPDSHSMGPGGSSGLPGGELADDGGQTVWRVQYVRRRLSDLTYTPQISSDLTTFQPLTGSETVELIDAEWERVTIDEPCDPAATPQCFSVVEVALAP